MSINICHTDIRKKDKILTSGEVSERAVKGKGEPVKSRREEDG